MSSFQSVGARLAVERATADAHQLLVRAGLENVVLRGPPLKQRLYEHDEQPLSMDVDLLVPDLARGSEVLERDGYMRIVDWTAGMDKHAWTHAREDSVSVDLHQTLVGIEAPPTRAWEIFRRESEEASVCGSAVRSPVLAAHLAIVALHAAQHGAQGKKPLADLERGIGRFGAAEWQRAAEIARELEADQAFAAGLTLLPTGLALLPQLGLTPPQSRTVLLRAGSAPPTALGLDRMSQLKARDRVSFLVGKLFPDPSFMRAKYALARLGAPGLALSYVYRLVSLAVQLPRGIANVREAGRRPTSRR